MAVTPGFLSPHEADQLNRMLDAQEADTRAEAGKHGPGRSDVWMKCTGFDPSTGFYAWNSVIVNPDGTRRDADDPTFGTVAGVNGAANTWSPAIEENGRGVPERLPLFARATRVVSTDNLGDIHYFSAHGFYPRSPQVTNGGIGPLIDLILPTPGIWQIVGSAVSLVVPAISGDNGASVTVIVSPSGGGFVIGGGPFYAWPPTGGSGFILGGNVTVDASGFLKTGPGVPIGLGGSVTFTCWYQSPGPGQPGFGTGGTVRAQTSAFAYGSAFWTIQGIRFDDLSVIN